jgi:signal transduction histidine kinase
MRRVMTLLSPLSQRTKLVGLFAALLAVLFVTLATLLPARVDDQSRALVESRAQELARLAAASAEAALDFDDRVSAMRVLGDLQHTRGAAYAVLVRDGSEELAAWSKPEEGLPLSATGAEEVLYRGGLLHLRVPLATRLGRHGALLVGFRLDDLEARRRETRAFVAGACLLVFAAGLVATFAIGTLLVRPLQEITAVARRVAAGDVSAAADLPLVRGDETGAVARALAHMLDRLYQQKATIEELAARLEQRVVDRTAELEAANRELAERLAELKITQEQLIIADRRVSIGRLAAGVAHEINNPLAFIMANLGYAAEELRELVSLARSGGDRAALERLATGLSDAISESHQGAERVRHIVRGLKIFARTDEDKRAPVNMQDALEAAIDMSAHELKHRARLVREISASPRVDGNEVRLSQVFLNLLLNAAQAICGVAGEGLIRVTLGTDARGWAVAEVHDNGAGIARENLSRIFDPFFTTKPVGVGTGLGLSISQGIVLSMGGEIAVESETGAGTTFRVALPPSTASQAEPPPAPSAPDDVPQRQLLVVDDDPLVGAAVRRAVARRHRVTVATSGWEALELVRAGARFDHILCDVMMPGMTGTEFHAELARAAPGQAAVVTFMTGSIFTNSALEFAEHHPETWLEKPFDLEKLRRIVDAKA